MHTYTKKRIKFVNIENVFTILELVISCIVFSLFLFAAYAALDIGLKSWQLGETKSDLHQRAEIVLNRITKDFNSSNYRSVQIDNNGNPDELNEFICFETPFNKADNSFEIDSGNFASPVWQGYILYYISPRIKVVPLASERNIYRRFEEKPSPCIYPSPLTDSLTSLSIYLNDTSGDNIRTIVQDIYSIDFDSRGNVLVVNVYFKKHIRSNASVSFSPGPDATSGTEILKMSASVRAEN